MPEAFKPGLKIEIWLHRMEVYLPAAQINSSQTQALQLGNNLNSEAFQIMSELKLEKSIWTDYKALSNALLERFKDRKTETAYMLDFYAVKQAEKEDVGDFLDRVERLAKHAYPKLFSKNGEEQLQLELVSKALTTGLRSDQIAEDLAETSPENLAELRTILMRLQAKETQLLLRKTGRSHLSAASNSAAPAANTSEQPQQQQPQPQQQQQQQQQKRSSRKQGEDVVVDSKTPTSLAVFLIFRASSPFSEAVDAAVVATKARDQEARLAATTVVFFATSAASATSRPRTQSQRSRPQARQQSRAADADAIITW